MGEEEGVVEVEAEELDEEEDEEEEEDESCAGRGGDWDMKGMF